MTGALWSWDEVVAASGGAADGEPGRAITGFAIDTRTLAPGDVFVALKGQRDGHDFLETAFTKGAAAALVRETYARHPGDGPLIRVADTLDGLTSIARAARFRLSEDAGVVAVTGSVGKTTTKEMLRVCLSRLGPTHAPERSFNNHWGVPLTLARMPASTRYVVLEIGMNHPGEITPLAQLARPHVAIITTVEPVHLGYFASVEAIADAKAEIMTGIELGGVAVLNRDNPHFSRLEHAARTRGADVVSFGEHPGAYVRLVRGDLTAHGSDLEVDCGNGRIVYRVAAPGRHMAINSLAVAAAIEALGSDFESTIYAIGGLAGFAAPTGRGSQERLDGRDGAILLIDESYNANPASMRAALGTLALVPRSYCRRRIAVLGDMLELGEGAAELHADLAGAVEDAGVDLVLAAGPNMKALYDKLDPRRRGLWTDAAAGLVDAASTIIRAGDVVMVKGSYGSRMGPIVEALRAKFGGSRG